MKVRKKAIVVIVFTLKVLIMMSSSSNVSSAALYLLGDSSVDCGDNTLFYPIFHHNLSLHPCNGSDSSLLPHFLGTLLSLSFPLFLFLSVAFFSKIFNSYIIVFNFSSFHLFLNFLELRSILPFHQIQSLICDITYCFSRIKTLSSLVTQSFLRSIMTTSYAPLINQD